MRALFFISRKRAFLFKLDTQSFSIEVDPTKPFEKLLKRVKKRSHTAISRLIQDDKDLKTVTPKNLSQTLTSGESVKNIFSAKYLLPTPLVLRNAETFMTLRLFLPAH